jgi:uncharacterized protein (TIGR00255 family)
MFQLHIAEQAAGLARMEFHQQIDIGMGLGLVADHRAEQRRRPDPEPLENIAAIVQAGDYVVAASGVAPPRQAVGIGPQRLHLIGGDTDHHFDDVVVPALGPAPILHDDQDIPVCVAQEGWLLPFGGPCIRDDYVPEEATLTVASMTGYARSEGRDPQVSWVWEAKSVNGRSLDLRIRVPSGHDAIEPYARETASRHLKRGNVQLSLQVSRITEAQAVRINTVLLDQILAACADGQARHPGIAPPRWDGLLSLRGVIEPMEAEDVDAEPVRLGREAAMKAGLDQVMSALAEMRRAEGARMAAVLCGQLDEISVLAVRAGACAVLRPEAVKARLRAQIAAVIEAAPTLSEDRIAQEVALIAVKADIREELDRLAAHVAAARELIAGGGAIGRKLDFLSQEFNREANTLCSKSSDVELTRVGLDLKAVIDQFREQVQNIE